MNNVPASSVEALGQAVDAVPGGSADRLQLERDGRLSFVALEPDQGSPAGVRQQWVIPAPRAPNPPRRARACVVSRGFRR